MMTEEAVKKYFDGIISVDVLSADLKNSIIKTGYDTSKIYITPFEEEGEYFISRQHLLKLCNDTIDGNLTPIDLNTVACGLMASDYFHWDNTTKEGKIITDTLFDWDNPEICFPITKDNLILWRIYLETGEYMLKHGKHNGSK